MEKAKVMLGDSHGGGIWLELNSQSAFRLDSLAVTEGIETGLSFHQMKDAPTIAATSTGGLVSLQLPAMPAARLVVIGADNDPNDAGLRAALSAGQRWRDEGREVSIGSPHGVKDWNDALQRRVLEPRANLHGC